jgi:hypothetical protein
MIGEDIELFEISQNTMQDFKSGNFSNEWVKFTDYPTIKLYYKSEPNSSLYTVYGEKVMDARMFDACSIIAEVQKFKEWIPLLHKSDIDHEPSPFRKSVNIGITFPWPMWNRGVEMQVTAIPVPGQRAVCALMKTIGSEKYLGKNVDRSAYINEEVEATIHFAVV